MQADILLRSIKQQRNLLLRKLNILPVKTDIDIGYSIVVLIKDKLAVCWLDFIVGHDYNSINYLLIHLLSIPPALIPFPSPTFAYRVDNHIYAVSVSLLLSAWLLHFL